MEEENKIEEEESMSLSNDSDNDNEASNDVPNKPPSSHTISSSNDNKSNSTLLDTKGDLFNHLQASLSILNRKSCHDCESLKKREVELSTKLFESIDKLYDMSEDLRKLTIMCEQLKLENKILRDKDEKNCKEREKVMEKLRKMFTMDQITRLHDGVTRGRAYTDETLTQSIRLWFASGSVGYEYLLNQGMPIPSISTLHKKLANVVFTPGRSLHIIELLSKKVIFVN
jgi:hypothetical protein